MKFKQYMNESKMGKLPQRIVRTAYMKDYPAMLKWELIDPDNPDLKSNYKTIEVIAWKELRKMKDKSLLDFYESDFNVSHVQGLGPNKGQLSFEADVRLIKYDDKKLPSELRKLKFKVK